MDLASLKYDGVKLRVAYEIEKWSGTRRTQ